MEEDKKYILLDGKNGNKIVYEKPSEVTFARYNHEYSTIFPGYNSIEELKEKQEILDEPCKICNNLVCSHYVEETKKEIIESNICIHCLFWVRIEKIQHTKVIVDNKVYALGNRNGIPGPFKGFGGSKWKIKYFDKEEVIETDDLWMNGEVPERFRDKIKNNAEFIK